MLLRWLAFVCLAAALALLVSGDQHRPHGRLITSSRLP